jgi:hypothetical protein
MAEQRKGRGFGQNTCCLVLVACILDWGGDAGLLHGGGVTRVNSTNVLDEGLRIEEIGLQMNSKVKSVKQGVYRK